MTEVAKFWLVYWNPLVTQISCGAPVRSESLAIRDLLAELRYTILEVPASTALRCLLGTGHRWRKKSVFKAQRNGTAGGTQRSENQYIELGIPNII